MRVLNWDEVEQVGGSGQITAREARLAVYGLGVAVIGGALMGGFSGMAAGPAGFLTGAIIGAGRAAFGYGFTALLTGAYALSC